LPTAEAIHADGTARRLWFAAAPIVFITLWASGFIGGTLGLRHAEPATFLAMRSALTAAAAGGLLLFIRPRWPATRRKAAHIMVSGVLMQTVYMCCIMYGMYLGVPIGVLALIAGMQPLVTAFAAGRVLGERVSPLQWLGFVLGFAGLAIVVWQRLAVGGEPGLGYAVAAACPFLITLASLYQKRYCPDMDPWTGTFLQHLAAVPTQLLVALAIETMAVEPTGELAFALVWLVLLLSFAAVNIYYVLLRRGEASRVASFFYLSPPISAVMGWAAFGQTFGVSTLVGFAVSVVGVALVTTRR
jgi:drug/metabolite transporter (DMT)-like permease